MAKEDCTVEALPAPTDAATDDEDSYFSDDEKPDPEHQVILRFLADVTDACLTKVQEEGHDDFASVLDKHDTSIEGIREWILRQQDHPEEFDKEHGWRRY